MDNGRIWQKNYDPGVPHDVEVASDKTINDLCAEACRIKPEKSAFINFGKEISFREFDEKVSALASFFKNELGLRKGDRIAIQLPNLIQTPITLFAAFRAGLIVVNTNPLYTSEEMRFQFKDSGVKAIVILENFLFRLESIIDQTEIKYVVSTKVGDLLGFPKGKLIDFVIKYLKRAIPSYSIKTTSLRDAIRIGTGKPLTLPQVECDDIAFLQYTGGTTGRPKAAILTHRNVMTNVRQIEAWFGDDPIRENDMVCSPLPFYHIFSLTCNCMTFIKFGCTNLLITNPKDLNPFIKTLMKYPVTIITGVNTLYNAFLQHKLFNKINWGRYRLIVAGGASLQKAVSEEFKVRTGKTIIEGYGLSETSPLVSANPFRGKNKIGTIGLPFPNTYICLFGEDGNPVPPGEPGEIAVRGPQVMQGYWEREVETRDSFRDGWFLTGDIGEIDEDGYLKIVDRKKDLILVSGFNVYPNEVENVITTHPAVLECAVVGVSDVRTGERPVAAVVKKKGEDVGGKEIRMHCKEFLTNYKIPRDFIFVDELPKSNVGKILRRCVQEKLVEESKEIHRG